MRRRKKTLLRPEHKRARLRWARWVLRRTVATLAHWIYTDGTVFYLARGANEKLQSGRAALGPHVWRQADGSDALYEDCVGPSSYAKAQGIPVRIWGLLLNAVLYIFVLPMGKVMNRTIYERVVRQKLPVWIRQGFRTRGKTFWCRTMSVASGLTSQGG